MFPSLKTSPGSGPAIGIPKVSTKSEKESNLVGTIAGPFLALPIITGPTDVGVAGSWELSISSTNTPGDMNLNLLEGLSAILTQVSLYLEILFKILCDYHRRISAVLANNK